MNSPKTPYPQEWPDYLSKERDLGQCYESPPAGYHDLPFEKLYSKQFEQLCWWLIQKDYELMGCQLVGGNGRAQGGIDLFAFDRLDRDSLVVFQCKCWSDFPSYRLTEAIDDFLGGTWGNAAHRFVLVIAQPELGKLTDRWPREQQKLRKAGVVGELWTGIDLTYQVRRFPDILSKFFPGAASHAFCNEWMQRVGFYERLQKALIDPRPEVAQIAKDFISQTSSSEEIETRIQNGTNWILKRPWVYLSAMLPSTKYPIGSVLINLHKHDVEGVSVVLSQKWLCRNFVGNIGAPLSEKYRPFLSGELPNSTPQKYIVDLENCRFSLSKEWVQELAYASDELTKVFLHALVELEQEWGAQNFPFVRGDQVALCTMPEWLWKAILDFSREHDYARGETDWHMFDAAVGALKPCTNKAHPEYDNGYHGIFYARDEIEGLAYGGDVLIVWSPPSISGDVIDNRKWWSCNYALYWIKEKLLPSVGEWLANRPKKWNIFPSSRQTIFREWWANKAKLGDVRKFSLARDDRCRTVGLLNTIEELQSFFHGHGPQQRIYLASNNMRAFYSALIVLLAGNRGYPGYIAGNLGLGATCTSHEAIIKQLNNRIQENKIVSNSAILDYGLRAMLEAIADDDKWLEESAIATIFEALNPLMEFYDQEKLIERHCKWI